MQLLNSELALEEAWFISLQAVRGICMLLSIPLIVPHPMIVVPLLCSYSIDFFKNSPRISTPCYSTQPNLSSVLYPFYGATMASTISATRRVTVPRLVLPNAEKANSPALRRQITVALGTSHRQRSARRDVIFHVRHGGMLEKQRPSARVSATARGHDKGDAESIKRPWDTARCQGKGSAFC